MNWLLQTAPISKRGVQCYSVPCWPVWLSLTRQWQAIHVLAYPISGAFHVPHGLSNALVLPHVLRFNAPKAAPEYAELAPIGNSICINSCAGSHAWLRATIIQPFARRLGIHQRCFNPRCRVECNGITFLIRNPANRKSFLISCHRKTCKNILGTPRYPNVLSPSSRFLEKQLRTKFFNNHHGPRGSYKLNQTL